MQTMEKSSFPAEDKPSEGYGRRLFILLAIALAIRIALAFLPFGCWGDINAFKEWGFTIVQHGLSNFYLNSNCDYPPLYMYFLGFWQKLYQILLDPALLSTNSLSATIWLKTPPILADVACIQLIYLLLREKLPTKLAFDGALFYALNPAMIFDCAVWGQVDPVLILFLLLTVRSLRKNRLLSAALWTTVAVLIKPQGLFIVPLVVLTQWRRHRATKWLKAAAASLALAWAIILPMTPHRIWNASILWQPFAFLFGKMQVTAAAYPFSSVNAFNIWGIGFNYAVDGSLLLGLSHRTWGLLLVGTLLAGLAVSLDRRREEGAFPLFLAGSALMTGFYLLSTRMHERYLLPALAFLVLASAYRNRLKWLYWGFSITATINMVWVIMGWFFRFPGFNNSESLIKNSVAIANLALFLILLGNFGDWKGRMREITKSFEKIATCEPRKGHAPILLPMTIFAVALYTYLIRLLPGAGFWDTGIFQVVPYTLSFTHPTGYPLYTLLGKIFCTLYPFGNIAYRMNLLSALSGAAAAAMLYLLIRRLKGNEALATGAALTFAFSQIFWQTAVRADPHTLHAFLFLALLALAVRWHQEDHSPTLLSWLAFLYGLSLGNHMLMTMLGPVLAAFVLFCDPGLLKKGKRLAGLTGRFLLGSSVYLYLPIRAGMNPPIPANPTPNTWENFWHFVLGQDFKGEMNFLSLNGPRQALANIPRFLGTLCDSISPLGMWATLVLASLGLWFLWRKDHKIGLLFSLALLVPLYAALSYVNGNIDRYYFNAFEVILVLAALGGSGLLGRYERLRDYFTGLEKQEGPTKANLPDLKWIAIAFALLPLLLIPLNRDRVGNISAERFGMEFLHVAKPNALVMSWWNYSTPLWYFHFAEGMRPDVEIFNGIDEVPEELARRFDEKRPIYLIQPEDRIEALSKEYRLEKLPMNCGDTVYAVLAKNRRNEATAQK